jgi:hypothetical protein
MTEQDQPIPPYEGRKKTADIGTADETEEQGAYVGGARRPTESPGGLTSDDPQDTPRGEHAAPSDEQPAARSGGAEESEASVGPAHEPGTPRGEDSGA